MNEPLTPTGRPSKRPFNKDGTPRKYKPRPECGKAAKFGWQYLIPKGYTFLDSRVSSPLRFVRDRFLVPQRSVNFTTAFPWNDRWRDPALFASMLLRGYLLVAARDPGLPPVAVRERVLKLVARIFDPSWTFMNLPPSHREKRGVFYVLLVAAKLMKEEVLASVEIPPGLVAVSTASTVLYKGKPVTPFEAAEELVLLANVAASPELWKTTNGIRPAVFNPENAPRRAALLEFLAAPGHGGGHKSRFENFPVWHRAYYLATGRPVMRRIILACEACDDPTAFTLDTTAALMMTSEWAIENSGKFLAVRFRGEKEPRAVNAGHLMEWLSNPNAVPLIRLAVKKPSAGSSQAGPARSKAAGA